MQPSLTRHTFSCTVFFQPFIFSIIAANWRELCEPGLETWTKNPIPQIKQTMIMQLNCCCETIWQLSPVLLGHNTPAHLLLENKLWWLPPDCCKILQLVLLWLYFSGLFLTQISFLKLKHGTTFCVLNWFLVPPNVN